MVLADDFTGEWLRREVVRLVDQIAPEYFKSKRWFGSKSRRIRGYRLVDFELLQSDPLLLGLLLLEISYARAGPELYQLPLAFAHEEQVPGDIRSQRHGAALVLQTPHGNLWAYDAFADDAIWTVFFQGICAQTDFSSQQGTVVFRHLPGRMGSSEVRRIKRISSEQSNTSAVYNDELILKAFRKLAPGLNPDFEVPYFLTAHTEFAYVPKVAGFIEYRSSEAPAISLGVLQDFVANQGDGYTNALKQGREYFDRVLRFEGDHPDYTEQEQRDGAAQFSAPMQLAAHRLGYITGLMHNALASDTDLVDFRPEPITPQDAQCWETRIENLMLGVLRRAEDRLDSLPVDVQAMLRRVSECKPYFMSAIGGLDMLAESRCYKTRYHGDYHLGQVLRTGDDFIILDFEGEPARSLVERRAKHSPLKDVAGMLRSFSYASSAVLFEVWTEREWSVEEKKALQSWALLWEDLLTHQFLKGYCEAASLHTEPRYMPENHAAFQQVVKTFVVEKAFYELNYEFNSRPDWIPIPANGLLRLLEDPV